MNNGNIYHVDEDAFLRVYRIAYNAVRLPSVKICQQHTRLLSNKRPTKFLIKSRISLAGNITGSTVKSL